MPTLIGAGIGAIGAAATGNNPFKGALLGGSLGTGYGGVKSLIEGGSFLQGAAPFLSETVKPAAMSSIAQGGGATMPAWIPEIGMANTFNTGANIISNATPTVTGLGNLAPNMGLVNKLGEGSKIINASNLASSVADFSPSIMSLSPSAGGLTAASTTVPYLQQLGYTWDEIKSMLPEMSSQNVSNVIGGANIARQYMQPRQVPQAPAGGVSRGNPPPATAVQELIAQMKPQQRKRISLLVG